MKITVNKCEKCGQLFEVESEYSKHLEYHENIDRFNQMFPKVESEGCDFENGHFSVQRSPEWLETYKNEIVRIVGDIGIAPFSYVWYRALDDGGSMYYRLTYRVDCVCPKCFQEWGQPYYAKKCMCF